MRESIVSRREARGAGIERSVLTPVSELCSLAREVIQGCEALNAATNKEADWRTYLREFKERFVPDSKNISDYLEERIKTCVARHEELAPLGRLLRALISYYSLFDYDPARRSVTHTQRWPEFKSLISDESSLLLGDTPKDCSEASRWQESRRIVHSLSYDPRNCSSQWDFGVQADCLEESNVAYRADRFTEIFASLYLLRAAELPTEPLDSIPSQQWDSGYNSLFGRLFKFAPQLSERELEPMRVLRDVAFGAVTLLRPECSEINKLTLELIEGFILALEDNIFKRAPLPASFVAHCKDYREVMAELCVNFALDEYATPPKIDEALYKSYLEKLKVCQKAALSVSGLQERGSVVAKFTSSSFNFPGGEAIRDALFTELAEIESSRTAKRKGESNATPIDESAEAEQSRSDRSKENSLGVAYGKKQLLELFRKDQTNLYVSLRAGRIEGFALLETGSPVLEKELAPMLEAAFKERGKANYSYLSLIVFRKDCDRTSCPQLLSAIKDCGITKKAPHILFWCRNDNGSSLAFLRYGAEALPAMIEIRDMGVYMKGRIFLLSSHPAPLQRLMQEGLGLRQFDRVKGELVAGWSRAAIPRRRRTRE